MIFLLCYYVVGECIAAEADLEAAYAEQKVEVASAIAELQAKHEIELQEVSDVLVLLKKLKFPFTNRLLLVVVMVVVLLLLLLICLLATVIGSCSCG